MKVAGKDYRSIWKEPGKNTFFVIDQSRLPLAFEILEISDVQSAADIIRTMKVRGAPLIGASAAFGLALAATVDPSDAGLEQARALLHSTRPTAVNLQWALDAVMAAMMPLPLDARAQAAFDKAQAIADDDAKTCSAIGDFGHELFQKHFQTKGEGPLNILTHCNAGWLATVDWGTALAPIYKAHNAGMPVHVWVDETRPRNQGARLSAWELAQHGVPHTVIVDNAGGHLMQHGQVDLCIVGTDRTTRSGDVCNKIGTYLKALAAKDNGVPFYVALPHSTIDWQMRDGIKEIPIEERDADEVRRMGLGDARVMVMNEGSDAANPAFDVTPSRLVTALITERGVCDASEAGLLSLYPEAS